MIDIASLLDKDELLNEVINELGITTFPIYQDQLMDIADLLIEKVVHKIT